MPQEETYERSALTTFRNKTPIIIRGNMEIEVPVMYKMNIFMGICFAGAREISHDRCKIEKGGRIIESIIFLLSQHARRIARTLILGELSTLTMRFVSFSLEIWLLLKAMFG